MKSFFYSLLIFFVAVGWATAQEQSGGWRRFGEPPRAAPGDSQNSTDYRNEPLPAELVIKAGTFVTARIDQPLSSDHNDVGDAFSATLIKPVVVDGVMVAQRGQTLAGRVVEAQKAGRAKGVSRLGIQLTELTLVDGQQVSIQSQLISRSGATSTGRDAGAIAGTTALGAAIGGAADYGRGAAIGAGAGALAGVVGVLLTRGRSTEIYPESWLTFRIEAPVTISTERAPHAFRYVEPNAYERSYEVQRRPPPPPPPYYYRPVYYPPYYGGGVVIFAGPRFYYGPRYYGGFHVYHR
jgi:hypothetical protein